MPELPSLPAWKALMAIRSSELGKNSCRESACHTPDILEIRDNKQCILMNLLQQEFNQIGRSLPYDVGNQLCFYVSFTVILGL